MATNGTCYSSYARNSRLKIYWERTGTWNTSSSCGSNIKWKLELENGNQWYSNAIKCYAIYINGSKVSDGGTWSNYTSSGTYTLIDWQTTSITHNNDGTKSFNINFSGWFYSSYNVSGSTDFTLDTIPRYPSVSQSLNTRTLNSIKMNYSSDSTCDYLWYSTNNGSNWTGIDITDGTSGTYTITGLSPNTTYNVKTRLRRKDSQLTADSSALSVTTYQIGQISSVSNFDHGSSTTLVTTNPSGSSLNVVMKIGNTQILSQSVSTGNNTISFNDTQLDNIYKLYGTGTTLTATFILTTAGNASYTNTKTATITLKGNQKTYWTNVSGSWKRSKLWTNVNGTWKRAVIWTNVNGSWKRGI